MLMFDIFEGDGNEGTFFKETIEAETPWQALEIYFACYEHQGMQALNGSCYYIAEAIPHQE